MIERIRHILKKDVQTPPKMEAVVITPANTDPTVASEEEVNAWFANLKPLKPAEAIETRDDLLRVAEELFGPARPRNRHQSNS